MFGYQQMKNMSDIQLMVLEDLLSLCYRFGWEESSRSEYLEYQDAKQQLEEIGVEDDWLLIMSTIHNIQFDRLEFGSPFEKPCSLANY